MSVKVITKFPDINDFNYNYASWNRQFVENNVILNGKFSYLYYPIHWTNLSLKFAFGGNEHYILDKMRYGVDDERYLILNRDTVYESLIESEKPVESLTLNFTSGFVDDVFYSTFNPDDYLMDYPELRDRFPVNFFQKLYEYDSKIKRQIQTLKSQIALKETEIGRVNESMHLILGYIFRLQLKNSREVDSINSIKRSTRYELYKRLNIAKDYMQSNYSEPVDLEKVASVACMCPHHLLRKFKSYLGVTPHQYLTTIRMERARNLVEYTNDPITDICFNAGYESLSSFSFVFRKRYNNSPENHRKQHLKKVNFQIA
ncbi:MAG: helix-turn-helix domain-containing protein [Ignavibacteria bacterium]